MPLKFTSGQCTKEFSILSAFIVKRAFVWPIPASGTRANAKCATRPAKMTKTDENVRNATKFSRTSWPSIHIVNFFMTTTMRWYRCKLVIYVAVGETVGGMIGRCLFLTQISPFFDIFIDILSQIITLHPHFF